MKYFMIGGDKREYGPVDAELIRQWIRDGRANGETLLRLETETEWKPLRAFADFQAEFPSAQTAPTIVAGPVAPSNVRIHPGHCFARAWHLVGEHFGVAAGSSALVLMALTAMSISCQVGPLIAMLFEGPFYGALFLLFLNLIRTGEATPGQLFALTRDNTASLMVTWLLISFLSVAFTCCCIVPGIFLYIAWLLAIPIIAVQSIGFWQAMEMSRRIIIPQWFRFFALFLISFLPVVVFQIYFFSRITGDMVPHLASLFSTPTPTPAQITEFQSRINEVGLRYASWFLIKQALLLFTLPLGMASLAFAYEDIFGRKR